MEVDLSLHVISDKLLTVSGLRILYWKLDEQCPFYEATLRIKMFQSDSHAVITQLILASAFIYNCLCMCAYVFETEKVYAKDN